jgi:2-polyprenyl-6-methoxyphenol hydroxylase-like FAD-dependent oxidoreductase
MRNRNVLISGAGPAGMTLAYWLRRDGFSPAVLERPAAARRRPSPAFQRADRTGLDGLHP